MLIDVTHPKFHFFTCVYKDTHALCDKKSKVSTKISFVIWKIPLWYWKEKKMEGKVREREKDNFWFQNILILSL